MKIVEKLQKRIQEGKKNNKGFSLVELIIVIAIMAILIGIVGMNVLPQIENARQSKDLQVLSAYLTESVEAVTQNASKCSDTAYTLKIDKTNGVSCDGDNSVTGDTGDTAILNTFLELSGLSADGFPKFESTAGKGISTITINLNLSTATVSGSDDTYISKLTVTGDDGKLVDATNGLTSK